MNHLTYDVADLLLAMEQEMRRIDLWETEAPSDAALSSLAPFCHDTLHFHQWLQWVFLPKMQMIVEADEGWPSTSDIFPLAEYSFQKLEQDTVPLLALIQQFDNLINRSSL